VRAFDLRTTRYLGLAKTHLQNLFIATAINLQRIADFLADHSPATTRTSAFARLALA
jgi:transposase